ncbi:MAG: hypothetical protein ABR905_17955, partial [Terracidiphilus sp.]
PSDPRGYRCDMESTRTTSLDPNVNRQDIIQSRMKTERGIPHEPSRKNIIDPPSIDPAKFAKTILTAS